MSQKFQPNALGCHAADPQPSRPPARYPLHPLRAALLLTAITLLATAGIASAQFVWTSRNLPRNWVAVACSSTGQYLIAACYTQVHGFFI